MATITLNWTPATGMNYTEQLIQYRESETFEWITFRTVHPNDHTIDVTGLEDNKMYEFKIVTNCIFGGPAETPIVTAMKLNCPVLTFTNDYNFIQFAFNHLGGHVSGYLVEMLHLNGNVVNSWSFQLPVPAVCTGMMINLTPLTTYRFRVTVQTGYEDRVCALVETATTEPPACDPPTDVSVTIN